MTSAYTTSSHALQRSVTSLRPTTSTPVHVGLLRLGFHNSGLHSSRNGARLFRGSDMCVVPSFSWRTISSRTAVFRQIDKDVQRVHHDALEFPDGTFVLLTDLHEGQQATVLQLPASQKRQPRKQPRGASLTWADVRRSSGIKLRAAGIAGGSANRRLRRCGGSRMAKCGVRLFIQAATLRSPSAPLRSQCHRWH